jgi:P pilus assembly chaperone PapD
VRAHRIVARTARAAIALAAVVSIDAVRRPVHAQGVLVAPTVVFANSRTRSATMDLINTTSGPSEITIETQFGYPVTDSLGGLSVRLLDTVPAGAPSIAAYVVAYPRRFTLRPGAKQVVRLLVTAPATLADGEYWSRIIVTSKGGPIKLSARSATDTNAIQVGVSLVVRTVTTLLYRKGTITAALGVTDVAARRMGDSVIVTGTVAREGTGVFLGMAHVALMDASGATIAKLDRQLPVYYPLAPRYALAVPAGARGPFTVKLTLANDREDIPLADRLPFAVTDRTAIVK